jgi:hypothetical protein
MKYLATAAALGVGILAFPVSASAALVCNNDGDCWRTKERLSYPPEANITIYDDHYAIGPKHRIREAGKGRGYYRGGVWVGF